MKNLLIYLPLFCSSLMLAQDAYHMSILEQLADEFNLPNGAWLFGSSENEIIDLSNSYGGQFSVQDIENKPFSKSIVASVQNGSNPWDAGWFLQNQFQVNQGDKILVIFEIRSIDQPGEVNFFAEHFQTFEKEIFATVAIDEEWKTYYIPIELTTHYNPSTLNIGFHLANRTQNIEFGGFTAINFQNQISLNDLPSQGINDAYGGSEPDAPWRNIAANNIEKIRKADISIEVIDENGSPILGQTVRARMLRHNFAFGTAITANRIADNNMANRIYETRIKDLDGQGHGFNTVVFENDLKWPAFEDEWFVNKEELVNAISWLRANDIDIRGHNLIWPGLENLPGDVGNNSSDPDYVINRINNHLEAILTFPGIAGQIEEWDVINETVTNTSVENILRGHENYVTGREIYAEIFNKTRSLDSTTGLWLNDFVTLSLGNETGDGQYDDLLRNLGELIDSGVDIEGIGFQGHIGLASIDYVLEVLDDFYDQYGLKAKITEFDLPNFISEEVAATYLRDFMTAIYGHESMDGFLFWNFWDGAGWRNFAANLFRLDWSMTPAGEAFIDLLFNEWWTEEELDTDTQGKIDFRGFKGLYEISYLSNGTSFKDTVWVRDSIVHTITLSENATSTTINQLSSIRIHPNPAKHKVNIELPTSLGIGSLHITNSLGQSLDSYPIDSSQTRLSIDLPKGIYWLRFLVGNNQVTRKVVVH